MKESTRRAEFAASSLIEDAHCCFDAVFVPFTWLLISVVMRGYQESDLVREQAV